MSAEAQNQAALLAGAGQAPRRHDVMRLHGTRLLLGRLIWGGLALLAFGIFLLSVPAHFTLLSQPRAESTVWNYLSFAQAEALARWELTPRLYATYVVMLEIMAVAVFLGVGLLLFVRRSDEGTALFTAATVVVFGATVGSAPRALAEMQPEFELLASLVTSLGLAGAVLLFYLFPDRRFVPGWTVVPGVLWTAWMLVWPFFPQISPNNVPDPWGWLVNFVPLSVGVVAQVQRYRHYSSPDERQQTKWVVWGFSAAVLGFFLFNMGMVLYAPLQQHGAERLLYMFFGYPVLYILPVLLAPVALAFAALRYRLWDIDVIIRRTLVYGLVTAVLALFYYGSVVGLQWLFRVVTGERSAVAIALSTLALTLAFSPVRARVQRWLDRRFYRRRYDAEQALERFGTAVRHEIDLDRLTARLLSVVEETMQPTYISLWLRGRPGAAPPPDKEGS
ncbi:MAG: hypothetical protein ACYC4L_13925 [Chloroflexota bacterium]